MDENLITEAVKAAMTSDFNWGSADCCTFVCDVILKATGRDLMAVLRGGYDSEASSLALMAEATGGGGLVEMALQLAQEAKLEAIVFPFIGADLGLVATPQGPALALYVHGRFVARAQRGIVYLPASAGVLAWSVK